MTTGFPLRPRIGFPLWGKLSAKLTDEGPSCRQTSISCMCS